jgi:hypothetical protein
MPRIRSIKPEFWADEKLGPMSATTRLVFLGLISMADDLGRLVDSEKQIDAFIFPYSSETCRRSLADLSSNGRIIRGGTANGQKIIQLANWHHQKIDKPNHHSALPPIADTSPNDRGDVDDGSVPGSGSGSVPTIMDRGAGAPSPSRRRSTLAEPTETELAVVECWATYVGETTPVLVRRHLGKAIARHGKPAMLSAIADYATAKKVAEKPVKLEWFAAEVAIWVPKRIANDDGTPNELGFALMNGSRR